MLDVAVKYNEELKNKMCGIWFKDKYKYYNFDTYYEVYEPDTKSWNRHEFASLDSSGNVIGFIKYNIDRQTYSCSGLAAINFTENKATFGIDMGTVLIDIFDKFKFNKLSFSVVIGNPIEKSYDKVISRFGGRIVGVFKKDTKLIDGDFYDVKHYEIFREDYLKSKKEKKSEK